MAPRLRSAVVRFDALPEPVLRVIMIALPADARARAACVCRSWRAFMADPSLWQVLDLTPAGGVVAERVTENLVRGAVARAAGRLRILSINRMASEHLLEVILGFIVSDGAELQEVNSEAMLTVAQLDAVFAAAPRLQVLNADVTDHCETLLPLLRNGSPYDSRLRFSDLRALFHRASADVAIAFAAAVAAHDSLKCVGLYHVLFVPALNALLDTAAEQRVSIFALTDCRTDADSVPALARLLRRGSLTKLHIWCNNFPRAPEESVLDLCRAVRACRTLTYLRFCFNTRPQGTSARVVAELLDAAAALPALSELNLDGSIVQDTVAFGRALGALLRANLPSLRTLNVFNCHLGDEGLAPLLDGLAANTHLHEMYCDYNDVSEAFKRNRLAPALAALKARR